MSLEKTSCARASRTNSINRWTPLAESPDTSNEATKPQRYIGRDERKREKNNEERNVDRGKKEGGGEKRTKSLIVIYTYTYIYTKVKQSEKEEIPWKMACLHRTHARLCLKKANGVGIARVHFYTCARGLCLIRLTFRGRQKGRYLRGDRCESSCFLLIFDSMNREARNEKRKKKHRRFENRASGNSCWREKQKWNESVV